jgi:hypothetical protein
MVSGLLSCLLQYIKAVEFQPPIREYLTQPPIETNQQNTANLPLQNKNHHGSHNPHNHRLQARLDVSPTKPQQHKDNHQAQHEPHHGHPYYNQEDHNAPARPPPPWPYGNDGRFYYHGERGASAPPPQEEAERWRQGQRCYDEVEGQYYEEAGR